jgi:carboxyl-terminal processing protease
VSGIGAEVGIKNNLVTIISPITNSPAQKAGLKAGDVILKINDESTQNMDLNVAVSKIRGEAGSVVGLTVLRGNQEKEYKITRAKVTVKSVNSEIKKGNIGYVSLNRFDDKTTSELKAVLDNFISKDVSRIVIDLRNNPGGYLDESVTVASQFIKEGVIVAEKNDASNSKKLEYKATGNGKMTDQKYKIVVLVNGGSASASEIVAGALKDYGRATIVGEKTFGKGSVQEIENLSGGAKLRVTIAHWYTPKGQNISKEGVEPDVEIELTEEDFNKNRDPQLDKALEILSK